jgi:hypothetical protein
MKLDCSTCELKNIACSDCVVTLLLSLPAPDNYIEPIEESALAVLADAGLVPQLRLLAAPVRSSGTCPEHGANSENKVG